MPELGFLGLGTMGLPMAVNLVRKSGRKILGYDVVSAAKERFVTEGGVVSNTAKELYCQCNVIFLCLPTNELLKQTVSQILEAGKPGTVIVDMGSTAPSVIKEMCILCRSYGMELIDSPVSGGQSGAVAGTLAIMSGGRKEAFDSVAPYLQMMGTSVTYMGESGCGSTAKLANNMMVGIHLSAMAESFAFAKKAGIDPEVLFQAIRGGFAQSAVLDAKAMKVISRNFEASARVEIHMKDIKNAVSLAKDLHVEIPMTQWVLTQMQFLADAGLSKEDHCALVKYYEDSMGVTIE